MKKINTVGLICLVLVTCGLYLACGCGSQGGTTAETATTSTSTSLTTTTSSTTTTTYNPLSGYQTPDEYFNASGAVAVASAARISGTGVDTLHAWETTTADDLVKFTADGSAESIIHGIGSGYYYSYPTIQVIETGPDGSLYIGLSYYITLNVNGSLESSAFFRIFPDTATVEVVDPDVTSIGSWSTYYSSYQGELPSKPIQFDADGNVYYLCSTGASSNILKKKTPAGVISQIGITNMVINNFLVCPNSFVLFQGSNSDYSAQWLRVITPSNNVSNIYYNSSGSSYGYLRSYYSAAYDGHPYVILVGTNLQTYIADSLRYISGVFKVKLDDTNGEPASLETVLDDNNMYSYSYGTIGEQLIYGYWDYTDGTWHRFFANDASGYIQLPLVVSAEASEASIRSYIRNKYKSTTLDTLDTVTFEGLTSTETPTYDWEKTSMAIAALNAVIGANIQGTTWSDWRAANGFSSGIYFGYAKQLLYNNGWLGAIIDKDGWAASGTMGDAILQVLTSTGQTSLEVFPQDSTRKDVSRARVYDYYVVYSAAAAGYYKLFRLDTNNAAGSPVDLTASKGNLEIYTFNYNSAARTVLANCYEMSTNSKKLYEISIDDAVVSSEVTAEGYSSFVDVVPFISSPEAVTETTTTTTSTTTTTAAETSTTTTTSTITTT
ncbi:MAG: hypothetical protein QME05_05400 [Candidatus Margulisbacteria bacterium]|nr:hypothetical protein [Candidatus Margulisiibacteriota bacterium]